MKKTIFIDIDGTLVKHQGNMSNMFLCDMEILPGVLEKLNEWDAKGYKIILTTGRKECLRKLTKKQLLKNGIFYDQLIMGLTRGERILINDIKPNNDMITASAIQINRDEGLKNIIID
jgi:histidinol phosphatase-like enzyme